MPSALRSIQTARRLLIPRQVQRLVTFQKQKWQPMHDPSPSKCQLCIREAFLWSLETDSMQHLSLRLLQSDQQAHLEQAHHWFAWAVAYAKSGELVGSVAKEPIQVARQVMEYGDWSMNRERPEIVQAQLPALTEKHLMAIEPLRPAAGS